MISKSSRSLDRRRKYDLYAEYGIPEYWVVDPIFYHNIEFFENRAGGFAKIQPGLHGRLHSKVLPGFWLEPEWVIRGEPIPVMEVIEKIFTPTVHNIFKGVGEFFVGCRRSFAG